VLQDNPKTLNAGISHAKRGLPMVIAPSGENILNFTKSFNQFFEAGQAFRRAARTTVNNARTAMSAAHSIAPPLSIIVWQAHSRTASFPSSMAESLAVGGTFHVAFVEFSLEAALENR
jgi:hypothetical protein